MTDLEFAVSGQRILWQGKPKKNVFILETIFNKLLIVALVWGGIDAFAIFVMFNGPDELPPDVIAISIPFFLFHLTPVWIYIGGIVTSCIKHRNTEYVITDRAMYITGGIFTYNVRMKSFMEISHINIHKGVFDRFLGVGDIVMVCEHSTANDTVCNIGPTHTHHKEEPPFVIADIADYQEVFSIIKNLQTDIYADTMYPNAKRPETNPGYNTKYTRLL